MTSPMVRLALIAVRGWTRVYTVGLPPEIGRARCAEIESDVWECLHDADGGQGFSAAVQVWGRLLLGVPDDLGWRVEHDVTRRDRLIRRTVAVTAVAALVAWWVIPARFGPAASRTETRVSACADNAIPTQTTPEFRLRIITCAGLFFTPRSHADARRPEP